MISRRMRVYLLLVIALSLMSWASLLPKHPVHSWWVVVLLALLAFTLSSMAVELPFASSISMIYSALFAALVYAGPIGAAVVGVVSGISVQELREHKPLVLMIGNAAQLSLSAMAAGLVYLALGGMPFQSGFVPAFSWGVGVLAPIAATTTFFGVNLILIVAGISLNTGMRPSEILRELQPTAYWVSLLVLTLLGVTMAYLLALKSWFGLVLLVLPFWMARRTFRVYVELTEAYSSTVRSLVTAIEAKDPYTRGHSERVAEYAQAIAGHMGLPQSDVQVLERAALLHDVGKIGISLDTLVSPEDLSEDEMRAIRRHPVLGADLITDVDFLHDIVDVVRCHHERCDGGGYPDGILGEDIPLLARILAAADSFDAMTSDRAYRPGMPFDQAVDELRRVAGEQLDERVVASFVEVLSSDAPGAMAS